MLESKLTVAARTETGKGVARRIRQAGQIPGICYGKGGQPIPVALDPAALLKALNTRLKQNTVIDMTIEGNGKSQNVTVMVRDYQMHPLKRKFTHVDFVQVKLDEPVQVQVPLVLTGKPEGVKNGGVLHQVYRTILVAALPAQIPEKIEADVTPLNLNDTLKVSDLKFGEGVKPLLDPTQTVANVTAPQEEKPAAAAEAAEGAAPAEGAAAGAAPAAGAAAKAGEAKAAGDKGAAAKPAAEKGGGKEKK